MRVLLTGGAGYIGAHTVRQLRDRGDEVVVLDDLSTGHVAAVGDAELVRGSITDRRLVRTLVARVDAVIHLAALKSVEESLAQPERYFETNVGGTLTVVAAAAEAGVRALVFSSSCAVYGTPDRLPVDETSRLDPENPYGESKLLAERLLRWFGGPSGLRWASLRYFNAAGAHESGDIGEDWRAAANLLPRAIRAALGRSGPIDVYGTDYDTPDGTAIRDYVHVEDLADAHLRAVDHLLEGGPSVTLNLGTGRGASVREVLAAIERAGGQPVPSRLAGRRPGDPAAVWADPSAAERTLGWRARHDLDSIVRSAWRWHSTHPDGYPAADAPLHGGD